MATYDLADLRLRCAAKLDLDDSVSGERTLMNDWANEGVIDILARTHCRVREFEADLTPGQQTHYMSEAFISLVDVYNSATTQDSPMIEVLPHVLNRLRHNTNGGSPPAKYYSIAGKDLIKLHPIPGTGEMLKGDYVPFPPRMSADTDVPETIPQEWRKAIELYMLWQGADYDDDNSSAVGEAYRRTYEEYLTRVRKGMFEMHPAGQRWIVNSRSHYTIPHDMSVY